VPEISDDQYAKFVRYQAGYGQLRIQYKNLRAQFAELQGSNVELTGTLEQLNGEFESLQSAAGQDANPDARVAALTGQLRELKHRTAFEKLAKGKVRDEAVDDLYQLSGYKPEADDPDEAALGQLLTDQLAKRPLFAAPAPTEPAAPAAPARPGAPTKGVVTTPVAAAGDSGRGAVTSAPADLKTKVDVAYAATGRRTDVPGRI
jgi:hypothetical protein